jgi:broad specificity phosphatase PhoE
MVDRIVLVRHGETEWSSARRHTGRTDIPLNEEGRRLAAELEPVLAALTGIDDALVLMSPLKRACDTCMLAGLGAHAVVDPDLVEWDYGVAEGKRTDEMRLTIPGWSVWTHPIVGGESLEQVGHRADRVLARVADEDRLVVLFAHAHILRILAARWCGLDAGLGSVFTLDPASVSILGHERETHVIERWNLVTTGDLERFTGSD